MKQVHSKVLLFGIVFLLSLSIYGQEKERKYHASVYKEVARVHSGTILVRLHTNQNAIDALKKLKKYDAVKYVKEEQYASNQKIYKAFRSQFNFCKVLFFYSSSSNEIKAGHYKGHFLDENLHIDTNIKVNTDGPIYIVDIGNVYFEAFGSHMEGLVIMNRNFEQLRSPFPYYVRKRSGIIFITRSESDLVRVFQKNLLKYYTGS